MKRFSGSLSNLVIAYLGTTIALLKGAVVFQTLDVASLSFVALIAGGAIGFNVLKDVLTIDGDVKVGCPTLAIKRGVRTEALVGAPFLILSAVTSLLPFFTRVVGIAHLVPVIPWGAL